MKHPELISKLNGFSGVVQRNLYVIPVICVAWKRKDVGAESMGTEYGS